MRIYCAELNQWVIRKYHERFPDRKPNVLISYALLDGGTTDLLINNRDQVGSVILDSGTWTVNKSPLNAKKKRLTVENYLRFLKQFGYLFDFYFNFDANFTEKGFGENLHYQLMLEQEGLTPVPVIHNIYDKEIEYYLSAGKYPIIALGSPQINSIDDMVHVMRRFDGSEVKLHLFGNTSFDFIANFPLYSCDSSAWAQVGGYGYVYYWNPRKEGEYKADMIYLEEYIGQEKEPKNPLSTYQYRDEFSEHLKKTLNITIDDLLGREGSYYKQLVNTHYYITLEEVVNQIHLSKDFISQTDLTGKEGK